MELPPCRSSLMSVSTCRRYGFSACSARSRKMRRAETCASKSVAICRERITRSREDTRSKKVMLFSCSARVFCPPPWMAVRVSPLCWSSVMAASWVEALTVPFWSSASYLNSAILPYIVPRFFTMKRTYTGPVSHRTALCSSCKQLFYRMCGSLASAAPSRLSKVTMPARVYLLGYARRANEWSAEEPFAVAIHIASVPTCTGEDWFETLPRPSLPAVPAPHDHSVRSVLVAMTCPEPVTTAFQRVRVPICTGDERFIVSPRPRRPEAGSPHAHSVPSVFIAKLKAFPADIVDQVASVPICTGEER